MPSLTRRRNESLWKRVLHAFKLTREPGLVRSQEAFQLELAKEISRSNRREHQREFALIHFALGQENQRSLLSPSLLELIQQRVRISDSLGWHSSNLAVLLPETDREGAMLVANDLADFAVRDGWDAKPVVYIYPWDDELISVSNEIARSADDSDSGDVAPESVEPNGLAGGFERVDPCHPLDLQRAYTPEVDFDDDGINRFSNDLRGGAGVASARLAKRVALPMAERQMSHSSDATVVLDLPAKIRPTGKSSTLDPVDEARLNAIASSMSMVPAIPIPWWKRAIDIAGAGTGLILLSPVLLMAAVAIKVSSPGPVLFRQKREGKGGKQFGILKFRTMVVDAEAKQASLRDVSEQDGPAFKLKDDPRITAVGKKLRKSCIDELPQLVNVLVGQMSLVGPRPLPVSESSECSAWQRMRLTVLPGLTCTWQARGGRNVSFDQWMRMDLDYIKNRSFVSDVHLIIETAFIALLQRGSV